MTAEAATKRTTQTYSTYIGATPQAIWDALTKAEWTERYGYANRVEFDMRPGGQFRGYLSASMLAAPGAEGFSATDPVVEGEVLEADAPLRLVQTWRIAGEPQLQAEAFSQLTYDIKQMPNGVTKLTVEHNLDGAPQHAQAVAGALEEHGAGGGWNWVLSGLKTLLETGSPLGKPGPN